MCVTYTCFQSGHQSRNFKHEIDNRAQQAVAHTANSEDNGDFDDLWNSSAFCEGNCLFKTVPSQLGRLHFWR